MREWGNRAAGRRSIVNEGKRGMSEGVRYCRRGGGEE